MLTYEDMVNLIADRTGCTKNIAAGTLVDLLDSVAADLTANGKVRLPRLGSLSAIATPARPGRNPRTGEAIDIAAGHRFKFSAAKAMKERLARAA